MPEGPEPLDNNIDITLSMLDGQHMDEFMKELTTVRDNFKSMTEDLTRLADSFEKVAEGVGKAGESASRPTAHESGETSGHSSSAEDIEKERPRRAVDQMHDELNAQDSTPTAPPLVHTPESFGELASRTRQRLHQQGTAAAAIGFGAEGARLLRGGTSDESSTAGFHQDALFSSPDNRDTQGKLWEDDSWSMKGPESLTPEPDEKRMSLIDRLRSAKEAVVDSAKGAYRTHIGGEDTPGGSSDPVSPGSPGGPDAGLKHLMEASTIFQAVNQHHLAAMLRGQGTGETQREYTGAAFGYSQTGGDVTIPGTHVGFRTPFGNDASREMIKEDFEKYKYRMQPGINKEQANQIFDSGYEQGFTPQTEQATDVYRTGMADMMRHNSAMAGDPRYQSMLGEAVKYGAISIDDFNRNMREIPIIAAKANVGLGEFMTGIEELSQQVTQMGGNPFQAADWGTQFTARTGLGPKDMSTLTSSPFFSTEAYQKTGLLPFEQGLMSGPQATSVATDMVFKLADQPGFQFPSLKVKSPDGGSGTIKGNQRTAAMVAQITGLPEQKVEDMLKHRKRIEGESAMEGDARQMLSQLRNAHGDKSKIDATMSKGHKRGDDTTTWGDLNERMKQAGFSGKEREEVLHTGKKKDSFLGVDKLAKDDKQDPTKAMEDRIKKMQEIEARHASKDRGKGGKTTEIKLDLTDSAKKLLKVMGHTPMGQPANLIKELSNAGESLPNTAFGVAKSAITSTNPVTSVTHLLGVDLPGPF